MSSIIDPQWMARMQDKLQAPQREKERIQSEKEALRAELKKREEQEAKRMSRGELMSKFSFLKISDFKDIPYDGFIKGRGFYPFRVYSPDNPDLLALIERAKDRPVTPTAYEIRKKRQQEEHNKWLKEQSEREARAPKTLVQQVKGGLWGAYVTPIGQERRLMGVYLTQNEAYIAAGNALRKIVAGEAF
jgi:hypothetical protein